MFPFSQYQKNLTYQRRPMALAWSKGLNLFVIEPRCATPCFGVCDQGMFKQDLLRPELHILSCGKVSYLKFSENV